ncbi:MAG TPA: (Fe-S)-binding protein [Nitrospirae bacterium]|nr:succinate dehydrogenase/fumarate reductase iron-sulfur subunit [bacterium BMS3Abin06]HDH13414.1 (Fe-S)-binding protein [Nitrospirota bacterium]HDZ02171.1 (Fe-S)-binding protein [Nitrospirota bacterium]
MADFKVPELTGEIITPKVTLGATSGIKPFPANAELMGKVGFPAEKSADWKVKFLAKMGDILKKYKSVRVFLDICVRCGACTDKCHYYLSTGDPRNMPVYRQELMRSVYRKYFTTSGKLFGGLAAARELSDELLEEWITYFYQCSECRRCSVFCPYGIDTAEITMAAREILDSIGIGSKYNLAIINKAETIGNNLGMPGPALRNTLDFVEEEIQEKTGVDVKLPLDVEGADILLVTPSADFFAEPHIFSLEGYAKVFHQAGVSWTLSSHASEGGNFGMFIGNYNHMKTINKRIWDAARDLKVKRVIAGECGHAWRVLYSFSNTLNGPFDFLDPNYNVPQHICDYTLDLVKKGAIKLDKTANDDFSVTFHDSCNVARASRIGNEPGGQFTIPRELINAACNKFVDMAEETIGERTFCCGGGGGVLTDELIEVRVKGAMPRMQALKRVKDSNGVNFFALICAICKAQFTKIFPYYGIEMEEVGGIHQLVGNAIVLGAKEGV